MRKFESAFADMAQAKRLAKTGKDAGNASKDKPKSVVHAPEKPPAAVVAAAAPPRWRMMAATTP
jgi:hypothetical protein